MSAYLKHHVLAADQEAVNVGVPSKYVDLCVGEDAKDVELFGY